uniref:Calmodulin n=1 Tax=Steinernema glaseri TaxID=37863 RepID=A0A1I7ZQ50_9BILA
MERTILATWLLLLPSAALGQAGFATLRAEQLIQADRDGDNALNFDEFLRADPDFLRRAQEAFKQMDVDENGKVSLDELIVAESERLSEVLLISKNHLKSYDANEDGLLQLEEVAKFVAENRFRKSSRLADIIRPFDKNGDGNFDVYEFNEFLYFFPYEKFQLLDSDSSEDVSDVSMLKRQIKAPIPRQATPSIKQKRSLIFCLNLSTTAAQNREDDTNKNFRSSANDCAQFVGSSDFIKNGILPRSDLDDDCAVDL